MDISGNHSDGTSLVTVVVIVVIIVIVIAIVLYLYCYSKLREQPQIRRRPKSQSAGRATDLNLIKKPVPNGKTDETCTRKIQNEVLGDLENETVLIKYKSDSIESVDTKPRTHV